MMIDFVLHFWEVLSGYGGFDGVFSQKNDTCYKIGFVSIRYSIG